MAQGNVVLGRRIPNRHGSLVPNQVELFLPTARCQRSKMNSLNLGLAEPTHRTLKRQGMDVLAAQGCYALR